MPAVRLAACLLCCGAAADDDAGRPAADLAAALPPTAAYRVVRDDTLGVRPQEAALYDEVLGAVAAADAGDLRRAAAEFRDERTAILGREVPTFADLFNNADAYRGRPVTLSGHVRVLREFPAPDGETTLVEAWLFTPGSQANPAAVVARAAPGLPRGDDLLVPATATGVFLKRYGYEAQDTTRVAPLILAATIDRLPDPAPDGGGPMALLGAGLISLLGLSAGWWAWRSRPPRRPAAATVGGEPPRLDRFEPAGDDA